MTSCHLSKKWSKYMIVVGVFRWGARLRRRRRSDMTWDKRTVSGMGRFLAGSGAELWGIALRHPGCDMVESSGGICALKLVHVYICTSIRGVVLRKRTTPASDLEDDTAPKDRRRSRPSELARATLPTRRELHSPGQVACTEIRRRPRGLRSQVAAKWPACEM